MDRECQWCGVRFQVANSWSKARFCSNRCRCAWNADKKRTEKAVKKMVYYVRSCVELLKHDPGDVLLSSAINEIRVVIESFDQRESMKI